MIWLKANNSKFTLRAAATVQMLRLDWEDWFFFDEAKCWICFWQEGRERDRRFVLCPLSPHWGRTFKNGLNLRINLYHPIRSFSSRCVVQSEKLNGIWSHCKTGFGIFTIVQWLDRCVSLRISPFNILGWFAVINIPLPTALVEHSFVNVVT